MKDNNECEKLNLYLDGALPPEERASVASHVSECPGCRKTAAGWNIFRAYFSAVGAQEPSPFFNARLRSRLLSEVKNRYIINLRPFLVPAGAFTAITVGVWLWLANAAPAHPVDELVLDKNTVAASVAEPEDSEPLAFLSIEEDVL